MHWIRSITLLLTIVGVAELASAAPSEGFYRQSWRDKPDGAWRTVGLAELTQGQPWQLKYVSATYCGSNLLLPAQPPTVQLDEKALEARMSFPPAGTASTRPAAAVAERIVEYRLTSERPGRYSGVVLLDGETNGYTCLERINDNATLVAELKDTLARIKAQQLVRDASVKSAYLWVIHWERELGNESRLSIQSGGGPMPNTRTSLILAAAQASHRFATAELLRAQAAEMEVAEMLARAQSPQKAAQ